MSLQNRNFEYKKTIPGFPERVPTLMGWGEEELYV